MQVEVDGMIQVDFSPSDQKLAACVAYAEAGEVVTVCREGRPVAQIIPLPEAESGADVKQQHARSEEERKLAVARLSKTMEKGYDLGIVWNGRDELYDRD